MERDTIIYVGNFDLPNRNAAGSRVLANGYIFREMGYNVVYFGTSMKTDLSFSLENSFEIQHGFESYKFPYFKPSFDWMQYASLYNEFISLIKTKGIDKRVKAIIFYGSPTISLWVSKVVKWCNNNGVLAIEDCVDWLEIHHGNLIFRLLKRIDYTYRKAYVNKRMDGIICISEYLQKYYNRKGKNTVIIPPLRVEKIRINSFPKGDDFVRIAYAGIPFTGGQRLRERHHAKDRLDLAIKYLYFAFKSGINFRFDIYGITKDHYVSGLPEDQYMLNAMSNVVFFHGYKRAEIIDEEVSNADFTILIRDVNRGTNAGFSTKFVQSISCGTPVITTNTSDIMKYMQENIYGFILEKDEQSAIEKIKQILLLPKEQIAQMKKQCAASDMFLYKNYIYRMYEFMDSMSSK